MDYRLSENTILNGKYIIESVLVETDDYIEYAATDLVAKKEVAIRELFVKSHCLRDVEDWDEVTIPQNHKEAFLEGMEEFEEKAVSLAESKGNLIVKNFFYENNTCYVVIYRQPIDEEHISNMILLVGLIIIVLVTVGVLAGVYLYHFQRQKSVTKIHDEAYVNEILKTTDNHQLVCDTKTERMLKNTDIDLIIESTL